MMLTDVAFGEGSSEMLVSVLTPSNSASFCKFEWSVVGKGSQGMRKKLPDGQG